jgi:hypothetical protein
MSDAMLRHVISLLGMLAFVLVYWAGYITGAHGWWFFGIFAFLTYMLIYKLVEA